MEHMSIKERRGREMREKETCKSSFCVMCRNFMGFVDCKPICMIFDDIPCEQFIFNGCPKPDTPYDCKPTEVINEYLLSLPKKIYD